ncbi:hypothetical protein BC940DRAFT_290098 [Gongronella butleri]|nr:hypothetical protein BC940DRAFT_290098 [Gongronella butleri]
MDTINDYEQQRLANIERNKKLLEEFQLGEARTNLLGSPTSPTPQSTTTVSRPIKKKNTQARVSKPLPPRRQSSRLRGASPPKIVPLEDIGEASTEEGIQNGPRRQEFVDELWDGRLLKADEYFDQETRDKAIRSDGHFKGWIMPELVAKYNFEASAQEAWEKNGGGTFSYKDPLGTGQKRKTGGNGRYSAKAIAQMLFKKNPNTYFYRHNEPGVPQEQGDWTEEEKAKFLELARQYGCGDKWGLFASYIPNRVGYQCSNFYRSVILAEGLVFDDNYQYTPSGSVIYVGTHRGRRG